jgi:hypothetical protein
MHLRLEHNGQHARFALSPSRVWFFMCTSVIFVVPYLSIGLAGCSVDSGNSRGARKLTRTPRVIKKKKSHINVLGPKSWILAYSWCVEVESMEDYCIPLWVDLTFHDREVFMWLLPSFLKKQIVEKWSVLSTLLLPSLAVSAVCTVFLEKSARIK